MIQFVPRISESYSIREIVEGESRVGYSQRPGYQAELPQTMTLRKSRTGAWVNKIVPMLRGYGFVRFDRLVDDWKPVQFAPGVQRLFMTRTGIPLPVPEDFVERLIREAPERLKLREGSLDLFDVGQRLEVCEGAFTGFPAVCMDCDGRTTSAEVYLFGRSVRLTLPRSHFMAAAGPVYEVGDRAGGAR